MQILVCCIDRLKPQHKAAIRQVPLSGRLFPEDIRPQLVMKVFVRIDLSALRSQLRRWEIDVNRRYAFEIDRHGVTVGIGEL